MANMVSGNSIAGIAALIADPSRANMLTALMSGIALTAGELAHTAGILPSTASGHLTRLIDAEVVAVEKQGRHRYYRLVSAEVAQVIELLSVASTAGPPRYYRPGPREEALRRARTCYDHIAGHLGVAMSDAMQARGFIEIVDGAASVTNQGAGFLAKLGVDFTLSTRPLCRVCLDWSERRYHLSGQIGNALLKRFLELEWVKRDRPGRSLVVTAAGKQGFFEVFGIIIT